MARSILALTLLALIFASTVNADPSATGSAATDSTTAEAEKAAEEEAKKLGDEIKAGVDEVTGNATSYLAGNSDTLTPTQFDLIYNMLSLGLASMAASTVFFFLRLGSFHERYKAALCFTGLVTFIAMYHYFRIFDSFVASYTPCHVDKGVVNYSKCDADAYGYTKTGIPFNDAYRYVDWLLTVPLLLIEIVLVMRLSEEETFQRCVTLGVSSALMIANGYPGETSGEPGTRWAFWFLSMLPFMYIVYTLFVGLKESQESQPEACRDQVKWACWATVFSWCTYPIVYVLPMLGGSSSGKAGLSSGAMVMIQVGYTFSDIISKCGVGYLVYRIGLAKSMAEKPGMMGYGKASNEEGEDRELVQV